MYDNLRNRLDFDDLLFETRNKDYGAYKLRKRYNSVIITGIILASFLLTFTVVFPFILTSQDDRVLRGGSNYVQVRMENLEPPVDPILVPPAPPPPEETTIQEVPKYIPPVVVDTLLPLDNTQPTVDELLAKSSTDNTDLNGTGSGEDLLAGLEGSETGETFFVVEVMPMFRGGDLAKFADWVGRRTNYPPEAFDKKIRGTVFLTFIVEKDGSVSNVTIVKGVDPLLDNAAVRAISESPKWTPGLQRGQPVRVRFSIPLNFMF
jgi:protein TonB